MEQFKSIELWIFWRLLTLEIYFLTKVINQDPQHMLVRQLKNKRSIKVETHNVQFPTNTLPSITIVNYNYHHIHMSYKQPTSSSNPEGTFDLSITDATHMLSDLIGTSNNKLLPRNTLLPILDPEETSQGQLLTSCCFMVF